jgi:hypothetical protein
METTLSKEVIVERTALARLRVRVMEKLYAQNPNPTTLREYKAAQASRDSWDKLFMEHIGSSDAAFDIIREQQLKN